ncbi:MAG: GyrI-like domain-containing protein [Chlorobiaceae bacterium]|nr:GyrI-like domain-containing protein [Chlorobiaceae bacterium]NTW11648.1 GyrI-like domain-containing protein [Chlorobiaceae bacterium]
MDFEQTLFPEIRKLSPRPALTIRTRTRGNGIASLFESGYESIARLLREKGAQPSGPPFALYYQMDGDDLEVEFGFPLKEPVDGSGSIKATWTPSGKALVTVYTGPYSSLESAYEFLMKCVAENKLTPNGIAYEVYLDDPSETPSKKLKTQVALLLAEK